VLSYEMQSQTFQKFERLTLREPLRRPRLRHLGLTHLGLTHWKPRLVLSQRELTQEVSHQEM